MAYSLQTFQGAGLLYLSGGRDPVPPYFPTAMLDTTFPPSLLHSDSSICVVTSICVDLGNDLAVTNKPFKKPDQLAGRTER